MPAIGRNSSISLSNCRGKGLVHDASGISRAACTLEAFVPSSEWKPYLDVDRVVVSRMGVCNVDVAKVETGDFQEWQRVVVPFVGRERQYLSSKKLRVGNGIG